MISETNDIENQLCAVRQILHSLRGRLAVREVAEMALLCSRTILEVIITTQNYMKFLMC